MIYIVEDDAAIRELEQYALQSSGYEAQSFESSEGFWQAMHAAEPELVILDVMLPGEDGFSILKKLRNTPSLRRLPIIMVTAKSSELDTVRGLDCGADDYITKPFGIMEFLSRVRAARRSAPEEKTNVYAFHEILLDNARHSVTVNGAHVDLTYKEYSLLRLLLEKHQPCRHPRDDFAGGVGHRHFGGEPHRGHAHPHPAQKAGRCREVHLHCAQGRPISWPTARRRPKNETTEHGRKKSATGCSSWALSGSSAPPHSASSCSIRRSGNRHGPRWKMKRIWLLPAVSRSTHRASFPPTSTQSAHHADRIGRHGAV